MAYDDIKKIVEQEVKSKVESLVKDAFTAKDEKDMYGVPNTPFHVHNGVDSPNVPINRFILYRVLTPTTANTVTNVVGGDLVIPFEGLLISVGATVDTAGVTGLETIDVNKNGASIMKSGFKITIDSGEKTSRTAVTPSQVSPIDNRNAFKVGDIFTFDIDGVQTTNALGLTIFLNTVDPHP